MYTSKERLVASLTIYPSSALGVTNNVLGFIQVCIYLKQVSDTEWFHSQNTSVFVFKE